MLGRRFIKRLAYRNYYTAKAHFNLFYDFNPDGREPLWIYQMGKVGSSTIRRSLGAMEHKYAIYYPHHLTQENIDDMELAYRKSWSSSYSPRHLWHSQYLRKRLNNHSFTCRCKVISLTRDPVARNISSFFNNIYLNYGMDRLNNKEVLRLFFNDFNHQTPLVWFDRELKGVCNLDVYKTDFPKEKGYKIYQGNLVDALVIRLESLSMCVKDSFKDFLDIDDFQLVNANIGETKNYASLYREFLSSVSIPNSYLEMMYASKYARHFYSEKEIEIFKSKWNKNIYR